MRKHDKREMLQKVGMSTHNATICRKITEDDIRDDCLKDVGIITRDSNICYSIQNQANKDTCLSHVGGATGEAALCEHIINTKERDSCYKETGIINRDVTLCGKIETSGYDKDYCYTNVAIKQMTHLYVKELKTWNQRMIVMMGSPGASGILNTAILLSSRAKRMDASLQLQRENK
jgi:hypothetical protein